MNGKISFEDKVLLCLNSPEDFKNNSRNIRTELTNQNNATINSFLDIVEETLTNKRAHCDAKFHALQLLKLVTSYENKTFLAELAARKNFLNGLQKQANFDKDLPLPEKGGTFFEPDPNEQEKLLGCSYLALLLEMIEFWSRKFGSQDRLEENEFDILYRRLSEIDQVDFPNKSGLIKSAKNVSSRKSQSNENETIQFHQLQEIKGLKNSETENLNLEKAGKNSDEAIAQKIIDKIRGILAIMKNLYELDKTETTDFQESVPFYYDELLGDSKAAEQLLKNLAKNQEQRTKQLSTEILALKDKILTLDNHYEMYKNQKIKFREHRHMVLKILNTKQDFENGEASDLLETRIKSKKSLGKNAPADGWEEVKILGTKFEMQAEINDPSKQLPRNSVVVERSNSKQLDREEPRDSFKQEPIKVQGQSFRGSLVDGSEEESLDLYTNMRMSIQQSVKNVFIEDSGAKIDANLFFQQKVSPLTAKREAGQNLNQKSSDSDAFDELLLPTEAPIELPSESLRAKLKPGCAESMGFDCFEELQNNKAKRAEFLLKHPQKVTNAESRPKASDTKIKHHMIFARNEEPPASFCEQKEAIFNGINKSGSNVKNDSRSYQVNQASKPIWEFPTNETRTSYLQSSPQKQNKNQNSSPTRTGSPAKVMASRQHIHASELVDDVESFRSERDKNKFNLYFALNEEVGKQKNHSKPDNSRRQEGNQIVNPKNRKVMAYEGNFDQQEEESPSKNNVQNAYWSDQNKTQINKFASDLQGIEKSMRICNERKNSKKCPPTENNRSASVNPSQQRLFMQQNHSSKNIRISKIEVEYEPQFQSKNNVLKEQISDVKISYVSPERNSKLTSTGWGEDLQRGRKSNRDFIEIIKEFIEPSESAQTLAKIQPDRKSSQQEVRTTELLKKQRRDELGNRIGQLAEENEMLKVRLSYLEEQKRTLNQRVSSTKQSFHRQLGQIHRETVKIIPPQRKQDSPIQLPKDLEDNKLENQKFSPRPETSNLDVISSITQSKRISNAGQNFSEQVSPNQKRFFNSLDSQFSPIEPKKSQSLDFNASEKKQAKAFDFLELDPFTPQQELSKAKNDQFFSEEINLKSRSSVSQQNKKAPLSPDSSELIDRTNRRSEHINTREITRKSVVRGSPEKKQVYPLKEARVSVRGSTKSTDARLSSNLKVSRNTGDKNLLEEDDENDGYGSAKDNDLLRNNSRRSTLGYPNEFRESFARKNTLEHNYLMPKDFKGKLVASDIHLFREIIYSTELSSCESFHDYKMACLNPKYPIYEDETIQIGATSDIINDDLIQKHQLQIGLFFGNKTKEIILDFTLELLGGKNLKLVKTLGKTVSRIIKGKQMKQAVFLSLEALPIGCLKMNCNAVWSLQKLNFCVLLPITINKFMDFKQVDESEFRQMWKKYEQYLLKSELIETDESIVGEASALEAYFPKLIKLEHKHQNSSQHNTAVVKYGGIFELNEPGLYYAFKINFLSTKRMIIRIANSINNANYGRYIIQTLAFLLGK